MSPIRSSLLTLAAGLAAALAAAGADPTAPATSRPASPATSRTTETRMIHLDGLDIELSPPALVVRRKGYCWFPSVDRAPDGRLLASMSTYADLHTDKPTAQFCWSDDGGRSWSAPVVGKPATAKLPTEAGELLATPYYLRPGPEGSMRGHYQVFPKGGRDVRLVEDGLSVTGWPRPDRSFDAKLGLSGFVFNSQAVRLKDVRHLATLYGHFADARRYALVAADSADGAKWAFRSVVADEKCPLPGQEGPCEAALGRLADGQILCVFRLSSGARYGRTCSDDEGRTWQKPTVMPEAGSVEPRLAVLGDGTVVLSGGRPGLFLWLATDRKGQTWQKLDLQAHHNACVPDEPIAAADRTSSYTGLAVLDASTVLVVYDRIPFGWAPIPADSSQTNSVWAVRATVRKPAGAQ